MKENVSGCFFLNTVYMLYCLDNHSFAPLCTIGQ